MHSKQKVAWSTGDYINCLNCSDRQIIISVPVFEDDSRLYEGRKCDWCRTTLQTARAQRASSSLYTSTNA